jgi:hypothetical protein
MKKIRSLLLMVFAFSPLFYSSLENAQNNFLPIQSNGQRTDYSNTSKSSASSIPQITGVNWDSINHVIRVGISPWPETWNDWQVRVDSVEIPQKDEPGGLVIRPNAPLNQPPTGLIIGTLPWVSGLDSVNFPCCGSLEFSIPGNGTTNSYTYNLQETGCKTASPKKCASEWTIHQGDWIIKGNEVVTLENKKFLQRGNIYIKDSAKLILKNTEMKIERGAVPTIHVYFFVDPKASLIIDHSQVYPGVGDVGGLVCVFNHGKTNIIGSPTQIHYFDMSGNASLNMDDSSMIFEIGGLLQVTGGNTKVTNSTIGALALNVPAGAHLNASGLKSGTFFENWKVQDMIPEANYKLTLDKVKLLEDDWTGELEHGSFERGWIFFLDGKSHVRIADSDLRKIFVDIQNDTVEFSNLKVSTPAVLKYKDIDVKNTKVKGEWGFTINDSKVTFRDSDYLFLQTFGSSTVKLINSHIVEWIPRNFTGTMIFENGYWADAGEFIGGVAYHSNSNNFTIKGSLRMGGDIRYNLQWQNARVTREFDVFLTDSKGNPLNGGYIEIQDRQYKADSAGKATFSIVFDEKNYKVPAVLNAYFSNVIFGSKGVDFFTETPIRISQ